MASNWSHLHKSVFDISPDFHPAHWRYYNESTVSPLSISACGQNVLSRKLLADHYQILQCDKCGRDLQMITFWDPKH